MNWNDPVTNAEGYLGLGMAEQADEVLNDLGSEDLLRPEVLRLRFEIYAALGKWEAADAVATYLVERHPTDPEHWLAMAAAARHTIGRAEAEAVLRRAVVTHTKHGGIWYALAGCASLAGRIDDALSMLQQALRLDPRLRVKVLEDAAMRPIWQEGSRS